MLARRLTFIVIFLLSYLLRSQGVADVFEDFTINDCVETPCQDIIVEGGVGGLSLNTLIATVIPQVFMSLKEESLFLKL